MLGQTVRTAFGARRPPGSQIALLVAGQAITHGTWQEVQFVRGRESRDSGSWCKFSREPVCPPPGHARAAHRAPAGLAHGYQRLPCPAACLVPTRPSRAPAGTRAFCRRHPYSLGLRCEAPDPRETRLESGWRSEVTAHVLREHLPSPRPLAAPQTTPVSL